MNLCGTVFATSKETSVRSTFVSVVSLISCEMTLVCFRHPGNPGIPPFCTDVSTYQLSTTYNVILLASTAKKILPSTLRSDIVLDCLISAEIISSIGTKQPSAICQYFGMWPFLQMIFINFIVAWGVWALLLHFVCHTFGLGAQPACAIFTTSLLSFLVGSLAIRGCVVAVVQSVFCCFF